MKIYITYSWYGGGGPEIEEFGPAFRTKEEAEKYEHEHEGNYHWTVDEIELTDEVDSK